MEMHQVRYFLAVSRTLNFTRAAEECNVSQPSLTKAIQKLEEELGGQLFRRERGLTHLTDLGRLMLPHLEQTYAAAQAARSLADQMRRADHAPLTVGMADTIFLDDISGLLREVGRVFPGLHVTLIHAPQEELAEAALKGDVEVAVLARTTTLPDRIALRALFAEGLRIVVRHDHPFAGRDSIALSELDGQAWVLRQGCPFTEGFQRRCRDGGLTLDQRHSGRSDYSVQQLVLAGLGLAPCWDGTPLLPGLTSVAVIDAGVEREVSMATVAGRRYSPACDALVRLVRSRSWERAPLAASA